MNLPMRTSALIKRQTSILARRKTYFANSFTDELFDNVPTCGIIHLVSTATKWSDLDIKNTKVKNYYFPKLIDQL